MFGKTGRICGAYKTDTQTDRHWILRGTGAEGWLKSWYYPLVGYYPYRYAISDSIKCKTSLVLSKDTVPKIEFTVVEEVAVSYEQKASWFRAQPTCSFIHSDKHWVWNGVHSSS
jgi:hypothetical protein